MIKNKHVSPVAKIPKRIKILFLVVAIFSIGIFYTSSYIEMSATANNEYIKAQEENKNLITTCSNETQEVGSSGQNTRIDCSKLSTTCHIEHNIFWLPENHCYYNNPPAAI
ncbi:MAG: hypothetical protein WCH58_00925 [Candidatus Saccharibacteria bacterium]